MPDDAVQPDVAVADAAVAMAAVANAAVPAVDRAEHYNRLLQLFQDIGAQVQQVIREAQLVLQKHAQLQQQLQQQARHREQQLPQHDPRLQ